MKEQPKNKIEESPSSILVALIMLTLSFIIEIIYLLKIKYDLTDFFSGYFTDLPNHIYFYFFSSCIIVMFIRYMIYCYQKKTIIKLGNIHSGKILNSISSLSNSNRLSTFYYSYKVLLEDSREVYTLLYSSDIISKHSYRTCTVYEYKGKFVFCDFK